MPLPPDSRNTEENSSWYDKPSGSAPRKVIRSNGFTYPELGRKPVDDKWSTGPARSGRLRPVRDAGMSIQRRASKEARRGLARRRMMLFSLATLLLLVAAAAGAWRVSSDKKAAASVVKDPVAGHRLITKKTKPVAQSTPIFASYKNLEIRLPVRLDKLSEVGFHQASYDYALRLKTPLPDADMSEAKSNKGTGRDLTKQTTGPDAVLTGSVLRMWRSRPGKPDTAIDVGADPGSAVLAPVSGTVVLVKKYKLYKEYPDYQIHIQPDGYPKVDCVLIHLTHPQVAAGDKVTGGVSQLARVRKFSDKLNLQLKHYTSKTGDHTHIQFNDVTSPDYHGLKGAITVEN